jgi:tetratricopeptide (TPR) repeat protein
MEDAIVRQPNQALRDLLAEAGWSGATLARQANVVAGEIGLTLALDRRSVSHWLGGRRPRSPVPELVAEALSRRLGRPVTVADTQLGGAADDRRSAALHGVPDLETELKSLAGHADADSVFSLAALGIPTWADLRQTSRQISRTPVGKLTAGQVQAVEQMIMVFCDIDSLVGGGRARMALAAYLAHDVSLRLKASASPALRGRMLTAATKLAYRCGFVCFDEQAHGLAQRYYRTALDLAAEAGDAGAYAIVLRTLSVQAHALGHHHHAYQLAEVAAATGRRLPPRRRAFLVGQVAVTAAAEGDRTSALSAMSAAERDLERAATPPPNTAVFGDYNRAALAHQQAAVRVALGDRRGAIDDLRTSIRLRPAGERRSRAVITARLAELQLAHGHIEEAAATWRAFLDDYPYLDSGRATFALKTMRSLLRPYHTSPIVRLILDRAATTHPLR